MSNEQKPRAIIGAMLRIQADIHAVGVGKLRRNAEQKFNFRGVDDAIAAFAPLLTAHGVIAIPSYTDCKVEARQTKSGGTTYNAQCKGTFAFTAADESQIVAGPFFAEANDSQDKGISKASSVAYRNCLFITFSVPHEPVIGGDPDGQGEPEVDEQFKRASSWIDAVASCDTLAGLEIIKAECIQDYGMPDKVPTRVKAEFARRRKDLPA